MSIGCKCLNQHNSRKTIVQGKGDVHRKMDSEGSFRPTSVVAASESVSDNFASRRECHLSDGTVFRDACDREAVAGNEGHVIDALA